MEMVLSNNFSIIDNYELELTNGGISFSQAVLLAGIVMGAVGVSLLFPPVAVWLGISYSIASTCGAGLTVMGLACNIFALLNW